MNHTLGYTETDIGTVIFQMNASNFEIQTHKAIFTVSGNDIEEIEGKSLFKIPSGLSGFRDVPYIEIPDTVLERKEEYLKEFEISIGNIGTSETTQGKVFFYLTAEGLIKAKLGEIEETTDTFYTVEGKRVMLLPGLDIPFVVLPEGVEKAYRQAKQEREHKNLHLVYAGRSLLTGKDYYKLSCDVSRDTMNRAQGKFQYFEPGDMGTLEGWLTADPEKVEEYLRIRNSVSSRKEEIEKQKEQAAKDNKRIIEKLMKA